MGGAGEDSGQFPDLPSQWLEVKLQTARTINLGLVSPDDPRPLSSEPRLRHCDIRFAVVYGTPVTAGVRIDHVVVVTGADFFQFFRRFEGRVLNRKLQIPLPASLFR